LQRALGVSVDGLVGPQTINASLAADPNTLVNAICDERKTFLEGQPPEEFAKFGRGWLNRVEDIRVVAIAMVVASCMATPNAPTETSGDTKG
jgi:lysozyme family protein